MKREREKPKPVVQEEAQTSSRATLLRYGALAVGLGVVTWLIAPKLLPVRLPDDFPKMPDLRSANAGFREALQTADQEARQRPGSAEAMGKLGMVYQANEYPEEARKVYRIAARLAPKDYQWTYSQAVLEEENGNEKEQFKFLRQTVKLKTDYAPALVKLADASFKMDHLDEAAPYYEKASRLTEGNASLAATFGLGRVAARRQDWNKVVEYIVPLTRNYSYVYPPYELLQEAYKKLGQADKAAEAQQAGSLTTWKVMPPPDDLIADRLVSVSYSPTRLLKQAGLMSRVGHPDRAIEAARRAAQADPKDPAVPNFLAHTLLTFFGEQPAAVNEAFTQIAECLRLRPDDLMPLWSFTEDFFKSPKPPDAVDRLRAMVVPHAKVPDAHYALALIAEARGEHAEAIAQYEATLKTNPNDSAVYNKLGQVMNRTGKLDQAVTYFQKAVRLNPTNTGARLNLGIALMQRGKYGEALTELGELVRVNPHDAPTHFVRGYAFLYSKRVDEAVSSFREGLRYKADDAEAHYGLASALAAQRKREDAMGEVREALKLRPGFPPAVELLHQLER